MSDELDKKALPQDDEGNDEDVEAHKATIGKTGVGEAEKTGVGASDDDDVEAHKYTVGKTQIGATGDDEKTQIG